MTARIGDPAGAHPGAKPPYRRIAWTLLRAGGSVVVLVALYYLLPLDDPTRWLPVTMLVIGLVVFIAVVAAQVRLIIRSPFPGLRATESLATSVPFFLLLFAGTYIVMASSSPGNFSQPLTRSDALYFTVTVFTTVGFGDITAKTETARLVVTGQMIADLAILGLGIKVIIDAVRRGQHKGDSERRPD
jgi:ion channel